MKRLFFILFVITFVVLDKEVVVAQSKVLCPVCNGSKYEIRDCPAGCYNGAIFCLDCRGTGERRTVCSKCNGGGYISVIRSMSCQYCAGKGFISSKTQCSNPYCRNGISMRGTGNNKCETCKGNGFLVKNDECGFCHGRGKENKTLQEKCVCDDGNVIVKCTVCDGRGSYMCQECKGYASIKDDCSKCKGLGYVYVYEK